MSSNRSRDELISVLMTVYNTNEKFLSEAISSILNQTYSYFEFIIIDDGSTNADTLKVLNSIKDDRVRMIRNHENIGLTKSLITGTAECRGKYIARMDSDDVAEKERLEKQLTYIKERNLHIIGSRYRLIPDIRFYKLVSCSYDELKIRLLFGNAAIIHSSAFWEKDYLMENGIRYNAEFMRSQDYALWCECISKGLMIGTQPDVLVRWRVSEGQISKTYRSQQDECKKRIRRKYVQENFHMEGIEIDSFIEQVDDTLYTKGSDAIKSASAILSRFEKLNRDKNLIRQELCLFWFIQAVTQFKRFKKLNMICDRWFLRAISPKNLCYICNVMKKEWMGSD